MESSYRTLIAAVERFARVSETGAAMRVDFLDF